MKTTIDISDGLFNEAKRRAEENGMTFRNVVELALRNWLGEKKSPEKRFRLKDGSFKGQGLVDGLSEGDWPEIRRRIYEGRGG